MILDKDTNTIYLSKRLIEDEKYLKNGQQIVKALKSLGCEPVFLQNTKDIWCRDYMPIQVSKNKFIEYRYDPDYLQGKWKGYRDLKTYPDIVCDSMNRKTVKTDIILDGGNVVKYSNCLILTDKVVVENKPTYSEPMLIEQLKKIFEVDKIVLIPWDKGEKYGHADGMLRFIDESTVLINEIYEHDTKLIDCLKKSGLKHKFLKLNVKKKDKRNWAYINFLQTEDLILLPKLNIDEDVEALKVIKEHYPVYSNNNRIKQVDMADIVRGGGALNCITWTIKEKK
jgi:agmatine deiminase